MYSVFPVTSDVKQSNSKQNAIEEYRGKLVISSLTYVLFDHPNIIG